MKSSSIFFHGKKDLAAHLCHNVQENFKFNAQEEIQAVQPFHKLLYHEVLLPKGAHEKFQNYRTLWGDALDLTDDYPYKALHTIIPLPEAPLIGNVALCKQIAKIYFLRHCIAVQLDIHSEDELDATLHGHLLVSPYIFSQGGEKLGKWVDIEARSFEGGSFLGMSKEEKGFSRASLK